MSAEPLGEMSNLDAAPIPLDYADPSAKGPPDLGDELAESVAMLSWVLLALTGSAIVMVVLLMLAGGAGEP
jgi:hypothetical protein